MTGDPRIELGMNGNAAYARYGEDLQVGEAEFVDVADTDDNDEKYAAMKQAFRTLRNRLGDPNLDYYFTREVYQWAILIDIEKRGHRAEGG